MINSLLAVQMNIFMVILLISIGVHACFRLNREERAHKWFFTLVCLTICILILEIFSVVLNSNEYIHWIVVHKVVDTLGFALAPTVPIVATLYAYKKINQGKRISIAKFGWLAVPFIANGILALGSYNFGWIFSVTDENLYVRGPLFLVSPITSYFYYTIHLLVLYNSRDQVGKEALTVLGSLTVIPALLSVFQLHYFIYLTIWNSVGIVVVINYVFLIHRQAMRDPLTGLGNRSVYDEYIAGLDRKKAISLSVVNIDMDEFKSINDDFGHAEGDKALVFFAKQLEAVFGELGVAIRWGGDEFIVLLNESNRAALDRLIKILHNKVDAYNERNEMSYRIQFSCGIAIYDESYADVRAFIRHSDKLMYEEKQKKQQLKNLMLPAASE